MRGKVCGEFETLTKEVTEVLAGLAGGAGEEAVMADADEAFGQDVEEPAAYKFMDPKDEDTGSGTPGGGVVEAEFAVGGVANNAFGTEGAALGVTSQVAQGGFAATGGLELDVPRYRGTEGAALGGGEFGVEIGVFVFEGAVDEGSEAGGKWLVVDEELVGVFRADEFVVFGIVDDGGNDAVNVGMVLHLASPGMEGGGDAETETRGLEFTGSDVVEGGGGAFEEEVVDDFGSVEAQGAEFGRDSKGDEEVRGL